MSFFASADTDAAPASLVSCEELGRDSDEDRRTNAAASRKRRSKKEECITLRSVIKAWCAAMVKGDINAVAEQQIAENSNSAAIKEYLAGAGNRELEIGFFKARVDKVDEGRAFVQFLLNGEQAFEVSMVKHSDRWKILQAH